MVRLNVGSWLVHGGLDGGEDPRAAALRDLREETGSASAEYLVEETHIGFPVLKFPVLVQIHGEGDRDQFASRRSMALKKPYIFWKWQWVPWPVEEVIKNAVEFKKQLQVYERAFKHLNDLMK